MIRMVMSEEHRVNGLDLFAQQLQAELGSRVDEEVTLRRADEHGATITLITRIRGQADGTATTDHGHAGRGAGTEEGESSRGSRHCTPWRDIDSGLVRGTARPRKRRGPIPIPSYSRKWG